MRVLGKVALPPEPVLHGVLELVQRYVGTNLHLAVGNGRVSSKTLALVKLRMEKLSSHFSGQGSARPLASYSTRILRANIVGNC